MLEVTVFREAHFNAAHKLSRADWSQEKNESVFGKCSNPHYHGHNYKLIVSVKGPIDPNTGFVMDLKVLKALIYEHVTEYLDHKNLNEEILEFKDLNPTAENISVVIWNRLRPHIDSHNKLGVQLWETPHNSVLFEG